MMESCYISSGQRREVSDPGILHHLSPYQQEGWNRYIPITRSIKRYLALLKQGIRINHNRIQSVLNMYGLSSSDTQRKWIRKRWVRYERDYSNSLWHADWHKIKDKRWRGEWLIVYEDDASRFITGYGKFREATSSHAVEVAKEAFMKYGKPKSILTDRGVQFYAVEAEMKRKGL